MYLSIKKHTHKSDLINFPSYEWMIFLFGSFCISVPHPSAEWQNRHTFRTAGTCIFILLRAFFFCFCLFCIADPSDPQRSVVLPAECDWSSSAALLSCEVELTGSPHPSRLDAGVRCRSRGALAFLGIPRPDLTLCHASSALSKVLIFSPTRSFSLHNKNTRKLHS